MRRAFKKLIRERARRLRGFRAFPESRLKFFGYLLAHVPLKQHLHGEFARFCPQAHVIFAALCPWRWLILRNPATCATTPAFRLRPARPPIPCCRPSTPPRPRPPPT